MTTIMVMNIIAPQTPMTLITVMVTVATQQPVVVFITTTRIITLIVGALVIVMCITALIVIRELAFTTQQLTVAMVGMAAVIRPTEPAFITIVGRVTATAMVMAGD